MSIIYLFEVCNLSIELDSASGELDSALMSSSTTPFLASPSEGSDQRMTSNPNQHQNQSSLHGKIAILWDIENCRVPSDVSPEDVAGNIRMALRVHPVIDGAVTMFSAYGDFSAFPRRLREGCQRTGVKLIDVPNGRKDAADKAILIDMFLFALDNPPPSSIMLISGDVDFAPALHILGQRGYTVLLVIPSGTGVSSALCNAGRFVWDWPSTARGEGFVPPVKSLREATALLRGCQVNGVAEGQIEEESIVYRGQRKTVCLLNSKNDYYVGPTTPTVILARLENKGKATQEDSSASDVMGGGAGSSDELSEEERMATQENGDKSGGGAKSNFESVDNRANDGRLRCRFFTLALLFYVFLVVLHSTGIIEINIETTNK